MCNISRQRVLSLVAHMACVLALIALALFSLNLPAAATVNLTTSTDATVLANAIVGSSGSVVLAGTPTLSVGISTTSSGTFTTTGSNLGLARGMILSTGGISDMIPNTNDSVGSGINNTATGEFDIATLTFSFIPKAGVTSVSFTSVFTSREYAYSSISTHRYSDNFSITLSGGTYNNVNVATIPGTTTRVSVNTLNKDSNASYYRNNTATPKPLPDIRYDGISAVLTHTLTVVPGTTYTATIRIADGGDTSFNAAVLIGIMPNIQLDLSGAKPGTGNTTTWIRGRAAAYIAGADVVITGEHIPGGVTTLSSATITLINPVQGDNLWTTGAMPAGIRVDASATREVITLSGTGSYALYQKALACVRYDSADTATGPARTVNVIVYGTPIAPNPPLASNTATTTIDIAALDIAKTYAPSNSAARLGDTVTYSYVITNTGSVPMSNVSVQDMHGSPAVQVPWGATGITNETLTTPGSAGAAASTDAHSRDGIWDVLAPGAAVTFTWPHRVTQAEVDRG